MSDNPHADGTPLVRTDFSDEVAWTSLVDAATNPSDQGFRANLNVVSDQGFDGMVGEAVARSALGTNHAILFVVDKMTMTHPERPVLCINVAAPQQVFRVIPSELWSPENNLSLANMDFEEFVENVGSDGIFRGF